MLRARRQGLKKRSRLRRGGFRQELTGPGVWRAPAQPIGADDVPLGRVLELAEAEQPSRLPLRT